MADRVELVDEADRAAVLAGRLAQRPEVVAHLACGGTLQPGLERGRRGEQERHAGLRRERLGGVRLAGARTTLEEQAAPRPAAHLALEAAVRQEQLERLHDLVLDDVDADDVGEPGVDLLRPDHLVRRPARDDELAGEHHDEGAEEDRRHQHHRVDVRHVEQVQRVADEDPVPEVRHHRAAPDDQP
jgi:hypothetical protein